MSETEVLSPEKHRQILAGAAAVFSQDGYQGASMSRIATHAGVSKGSLYNYFDSKADLFVALVATECERHLTRVFDIGEPDDDLASDMQALGERMVRMLISDIALTIHRLVVAEAARFPELAQGFDEAGPVRGRAFMAAWLSRQAAVGRLAITDPGFAAEQFFALCQTRIVYARRLGLPVDASDAAIRHVVSCAVTMFLSTYGAGR